MKMRVKKLFECYFWYFLLIYFSRFPGVNWTELLVERVSYCWHKYTSCAVHSLHLSSGCGAPEVLIWLGKIIIKSEIENVATFFEKPGKKCCLSHNKQVCIVWSGYIKSHMVHGSSSWLFKRRENVLRTGKGLRDELEISWLNLR